MDPDRWRRIEGLFFQASEMEPGPRTAFLEGECAGDGDLLGEVRKLLAEDGRSDSWTEQLVDLPWSEKGDPLVGSELGVYRLVERIAVGGMGLVYRAERTDGLFQQEVAVKLLRRETATEETRRRFELERRTLAAMNHPNIARLLDGGASAEGTPYLVMEFIHGEPIDRWCAERHLGVDERLALFRTVCSTVHFAHQNLIVHRDLKPGNILVDEHGQVKLLDFGIARLLEGADEQAPTRTVARVLTPEYASPEQLRGATLTTASDVYSLGVVLYELLTGMRPFKAESRSAAEWERLVSEQPPTRPSAVATTTRLQRALRGDLDRIVLKLLHKDPARRYASAQEVADDLERYRTGRTVHARPDSWWYRTRRYVARNAMALASVALIVGALLWGSISAWRSKREAELEAEHTRIEATSFSTMTDFVMEAFLSVDQFHRKDALEPFRQTLLRQADYVRRQFVDNAHVRANLLDGLAGVCLRLSLYTEAEQLAREAYDIRRATFGEEHIEVALSLGTLGLIEYTRGAHDRAAGYFARALALQRPLPRSVHTDVAAAANNLGVALRNLGRLEDAERLHREALDLRRRDGDRTLAVAESLNNLAGIERDRQQFDSAAEYLEQALGIRQEILGDEHPLTLQTMSNLGLTRWSQGRVDDARRLLARAEAGYRGLQESGRGALARTLEVRAAIALTLADQERQGGGDGLALLDEASVAFEEALAIFRELFPDTHPHVLNALSGLIQVREGQGEWDLARDAWEEYVDLLETSEAEPGMTLASGLQSYGEFLLRKGDLADAEAALARSVQILETVLDPEPGAKAAVLMDLGECRLRRGRGAEALPVLERAAELLAHARASEEARDELDTLLAEARRVAGGDDRD